MSIWVSLSPAFPLGVFLRNADLLSFTVIVSSERKILRSKCLLVSWFLCVNPHLAPWGFGENNHIPRISWRRQWHPTPVLLPGKSHGWRSLVGCSPWGRYQSDTTEWLHFHFSLSYIGEGNGNPLQCSCLENPRDGGAWWAAIYGVAQSQTRLKQLSSSSKNLPGWDVWVLSSLIVTVGLGGEVEARPVDLLSLFGI